MSSEEGSLNFLDLFALSWCAGLNQRPLFNSPGGAVKNAAVGAVGAAILSYAGFPGFIVSEAASMGAIGGGILGTSHRGWLNHSLFNTDIRKKDWMQNIVEAGVSSAIGYGVFNLLTSTAMSLASTVAAAVVGTTAMLLVAPMVFHLAVALCGAMAAVMNSCAHAYDYVSSVVNRPAITANKI